MSAGPVAASAHAEAAMADRDFLVARAFDADGAAALHPRAPTRRRKRVLPGFGLSLGFTIAYLSLIVLIPLSAAFIKTASLTWAAVLDDRDGAARRRELPAHVRRVVRGRRHQHGVRPAGRVGAGPLPLSGPAPGRCTRRPAVRAADGGRRHRADRTVRGQRLVRLAAGTARHQGGVHAAGRARRAHVHRPAVRRAHRAAGARGTAARARGGGRDAGRVAVVRRFAVSCSRSCCRR